MALHRILEGRPVREVSKMAILSFVGAYFFLRLIAQLECPTGDGGIGPCTMSSIALPTLFLIARYQTGKYKDSPNVSHGANVIE